MLCVFQESRARLETGSGDKNTRETPKSRNYHKNDNISISSGFTSHPRTQNLFRSEPTSKRLRGFFYFDWLMKPKRNTTVNKFNGDTRLGSTFIYPLQPLTDIINFSYQKLA